MRLAPGEMISESRKKGGQGAGWLPEVWKLKWGRIRIPCGMQFDANASRCREGVDIVDVDVRVFPL